MSATIERLPIGERFARACRLREYDKPIDYPYGAVVRFYYKLNADLESVTLTDAVLIPKDGAQIPFPLHAFSTDELADILEEIEHQ
jgi:hypothetical protein